MTEADRRLVPIVPDDTSTSRTLATFVAAAIIVISGLWAWQAGNARDVALAVQAAQSTPNVTISIR